MFPLDVDRVTLCVTPEQTIQHPNLRSRTLPFMIVSFRTSREFLEKLSA